MAKLNPEVFSPRHVEAETLHRSDQLNETLCRLFRVRTLQVVLSCQHVMHQAACVGIMAKQRPNAETG